MSNKTKIFFLCPGGHNRGNSPSEHLAKYVSENYDDIEGQYMGIIKCTPKGWQQIREYHKELNQNQ